MCKRGRAGLVVLLLAITPPAAALAEAPQIPRGMLAGVVGDDGEALPLDAEGLPARRLTDSELFRVLLRLSQSMDHASLLLARCHAEGVPFGHAGWRSCIERN